jgi:hypothetical protein
MDPSKLKKLEAPPVAFSIELRYQCLGTIWRQGFSEPGRTGQKSGFG